MTHSHLIPSENFKELLDIEISKEKAHPHKFMGVSPPFPGQVVIRSEWGARKPKDVTRFRSNPEGSTAHYEGPKLGPYSHSTCAARARAVQNFHMDTRGWDDAAYTSMTCMHGVIYVMRWWGVRTAANGTNNGNAISYAHCVLIGDSDELTIAAKAGLSAAFAMARREGKAGGRVWTHDQWHNTACPGSPIRDFVRNGLVLPAEPSIKAPELIITKGGFSEVDIDFIKFQNVKLGDDGKGWVPLEIPEDRCLGVRPHGSFPPEDGYWEIPSYAFQARGANQQNKLPVGTQTVVEITGGSPNQIVEFTVTYLK